MSKLLEMVMIVRNSGELLRNCLRSNRRFIDHWTIIDTGSTDDTPAIIKKELKGIPGTLHHHPFVDFSNARNKAFDLASQTCKYFIVIDDSYEMFGGAALRAYLSRVNYPVINIKINKLNTAGDNVIDSYFSHRISMCSSGIRYQYRVHEQLNVGNHLVHNADTSDFGLIDHQSDVHIERSRARLKRDIEWLSLDHIEYPNEPRIVYYLAICKDSPEYFRKLLTMSKNNTEMAGHLEYSFAAEYKLVLAEYDEKCDVILYQKRLRNLLKRCPYRVESAYKLALSYYHSQRYKELDDIISNIVNCPIPTLVATILDSHIYYYELPFLFIITKIQLQRPQEMLKVFEMLIKRYPQDQKLLNIKYDFTGAVNKSSVRLGSRTLVIHTGNIFTWNPNGLDQRVSGSEQMAMRLSAEFAKRGYTVFIFGSFIEPPKHNESARPVSFDPVYTIGGVRYLDNTAFSDFCLSFLIDYLVISRFEDNLTYYNNISKVYLWVHDVIPKGTKNFVQINRQKFKGFICLSNWQKKRIMTHYHATGELMHVSRNAIDPTRFFIGAAAPNPAWGSAPNPTNGTGSDISTTEKSGGIKIDLPNEIVTEKVSSGGIKIDLPTTEKSSGIKIDLPNISTEKSTCMNNKSVTEKVPCVGFGAEPQAGFGAAAPMPMRFVYTSDPVRGVEHFFDMIPKLREKYVGATFYVFGKPDQISDAYREKVKEWNAGAETSFIFLSPRVTQAQLAQELMKSDVWLYPSIFEETYCISAVEAMAAGCLVATISLAALTEIVGNRGILAEDVSDLFTQLCTVLDDPIRKQAYIDRAKKWAHKQTFEKLADEWERDLFSL